LFAVLFSAALLTTTLLTTASRAAEPVDEADVSYDVPDVEPGKLLDYIKQLQAKQQGLIAQFQNPQKSRAEKMAVLEEFQTLQRSIVEASTKMLAKDVDAAVALEGFKAQAQAQEMLMRTGIANARNELFDTAESLLKDERADLVAQARFYLLQRDMMKLPQQTEAQREEFLERLLAFLSERPKDAEHANLARTAALFLENVQAEALATKAYKSFADLYKDSEEPEVVKTVEAMHGSMRRVNMVGNEMDVHGKLLDGSDFDWAEYKGKVVLVDFWATWCGPCVAELPNVLAQYDNYHDRGFEVVGISLDQDKAAVEKFVTQRKLPWATLFQDPADGQGLHPVANHYGIMQIPFMALVGKDGKVISTKARGPELARLLEQLLGPASPGDEKKDEKKVEVQQ
jgi:thiol-disulfide isomerase/thioredoxin